MNRSDKIIMGVLGGGIVVFLIISVFLLFTNKRPSQIEEVTSPEQTKNENATITPYPTIAPIKNITVFVNNRRFNPQSATIPRGGFVQFMNLSTTPITVEANDVNSAILNIGTISLNEEKIVTFDNPGKYTYRNKDKPELIGEITVE